MSSREFRISKAVFEYSAPSIEEIKQGEFSEIALLGRSNVGKSSLINAICNQNGLAKAAKQPGRTQAFNYFEVNWKVVEKDSEEAPMIFSSYFVDLPGYGFAKVAKSQKAKWPKMIEDYVMCRNNLSLVLLLIDIRRDPGEEEKWLASLGKGGGLLVVLTKVDKVSKNEYVKRKQEIAKQLNVKGLKFLPLSVLGGKNAQSVFELRQAIGEVLLP